MHDEATVFVVDDDPAVRKSLRWLIESVGLNVRTFASAREFLEACDPATPGCLVLDVRMPGMSGLDLQDHLSEQGAHLPVIVITAYGDVPMAVRALKAGAAEFLQKPVSDQVLLDHIQRAVENDCARRRREADRRAARQRLEELTPREREVLELVVEGLSSKEIGRRLDVSFKTIEAHRARIMKKMQATSVAHLIRMRLELDVR